jgi:hypothetical protein
MSIFLLQRLQETLSTEEGQNNFSLQAAIGGEPTLEKYGNTIKSFINTKSSPDSLATDIQTKANTEAVIMILDKSGIIKYITNKFFLSAMGMSMREKVQLMETFGAANISFFGETARVYIFQANTIDAPSQNTGVEKGKYYYQSSILKMYNEVLRGTKLIENNSIAVMKVHNHIIYGYPLNLKIDYNASNDPITVFTLQFVVSEHTLDLPGVITEDYLSKMYSTYNHIKTKEILDFVNRIDGILEKINIVLSTNVNGNEYNSGGNLGWVDNTSYFLQQMFPDNMKSAYTALLLQNMVALKTSFGPELGNEISPLVNSKVPPQTVDKLLSLIPSMFDSEETYNLVATNLRVLKTLTRELNIFKTYRMNSVTE